MNDAPHLKIGIDPGVDTGLAIYDTRARRLTRCDGTTHVDAVLAVQGLIGLGFVLEVIVEDARQGGGAWAKGKDAAARAQGAGSVKRDSSIWEEWLIFWGVKYLMVSPKAKGAKLTHEQFVRLTGWAERTNQHGRDAAMLVWAGR